MFACGLLTRRLHTASIQTSKPRTSSETAPPPKVPRKEPAAVLAGRNRGRMAQAHHHCPEFGFPNPHLPEPRQPRYSPATHLRACLGCRLLCPTTCVNTQPVSELCCAHGMHSVFTSSNPDRQCCCPMHTCHKHEPHRCCVHNRPALCRTAGQLVLAANSLVRHSATKYVPPRTTGANRNQ